MLSTINESVNSSKVKAIVQATKDALPKLADGAVETECDSKWIDRIYKSFQLAKHLSKWKPPGPLDKFYDI